MKSNFLVIGIFLFLCACSQKSSQETNFDIQGHRGARGLLPENTIPSYKLAIELGVSTIEMDVVITADKQVVASHEPWFDAAISTTPDGNFVEEKNEKEYNIYQMTYDEVKLFDVGKRGNPAFADQEPMVVSKPLLRTVIQSVDDYARSLGKNVPNYNIETKTLPEYYGVFTPFPEEFATILYSELAMLSVLDRVIIQSFDPAPLREVKKIDSTLKTAMLVYDEKPMESYINQLGFVPEIWSPYHILVNEDLINKAKGKGMKVIPWTVNDEQDALNLIKLGVDGLITDYPNKINYSLLEQ